MNWKKWIFLPGWLVALLSIVCGVGLGYVFLTGNEHTALAYGVFALRFYSLCALVVWCVFRLPKVWHRAKEATKAHSLGQRYFSDPAFRTRVKLWRLLLINLVFAAIHGVSWYVSGSAWFAILAAYYTIMAVMRLLLVGSIQNASLVRQRTRAKLCGWILLLVNVTLSAAVLMILYRDKRHHYWGVLIYVMAMYAFYAVFRALWDIVRSHKQSSPVMNGAKVISLCAALVSMLNLETAMLAQFGADMAAQSRRLMVILTGAGVSLAIIMLSVWLILSKYKEQS